MNGKRVLALALGLVIATGCASVPPQRVPTLSERIRADIRVGDEVAVDFESRVTVLREVGVTVFLRSIAERLVVGAPELADSPLGVFLLQDWVGRGSKDWRCFALPGNRLYLSVGAVKVLEFENELAALIAKQLADLVERHAVKRLVPGPEGGPEGGRDARSPLTSRQWDSRRNATFPHDYFGEGGVFAFSDEEHLRSVEVAVSLLYRAGYDPRGLVSLWARFRALGLASPYGAELLSRMEEKSREAITLYAPLRNPIVRSDPFLEMRKRVQQL